MCEVMDCSWSRRFFLVTGKREAKICYGRGVILPLNQRIDVAYMASDGLYDRDRTAADPALNTARITVDLCH